MQSAYSIHYFRNEYSYFVFLTHLCEKYISLDYIVIPLGVYTTVYKWVVESFTIHLGTKQVTHAHQGCSYFLRNTVKTVILWNMNTI